MKRGPRLGAGANGDTASFGDKAAAAWGTPPDWVIELAAYADQHRLRGAADRLGCSTSLVSTVIANKYQGDVGRAEEVVRGALMGAVVDCPIKGEMPRDVCLGWQRKPYAATSSDRVAMYQACRSGCPHSKINRSKEDGHGG